MKDWFIRTDASIWPGNQTALLFHTHESGRSWTCCRFRHTGVWYCSRCGEDAPLEITDVTLLAGATSDERHYLSEPDCIVLMHHSTLGKGTK